MSFHTYFMRLQPQDRITLLNVFLPSVILTNFRQYVFQSHSVMLISLDEVAHACNPRIEDSKPVLLQVKAILSCIPRPTDLILIQSEMANFNSIYPCINSSLYPPSLLMFLLSSKLFFSCFKELFIIFV